MHHSGGYQYQPRKWTITASNGIDNNRKLINPVTLHQIEPADVCGWNHYSGTRYFTIPYDKSIQSKYTYVEIECYDEKALHIIEQLNYYTSLSPPKQSTLDAKGVDFPVKNSAKLVDGDPNNLDATMALADYTSSVSTNHDNNCSSYPHIYVDFDNNNSFKLNLSNNKYEQIGIDSENGLSYLYGLNQLKRHSGSGIQVRRPALQQEL